MFRVRDRVEFVKSKPSLKGYVAFIDSSHNPPYLIEWDEYVGGSYKGDKGRDGYCEWCSDKVISLIKDDKNIKELLKTGIVVQTEDNDYGIVLGGTISFKSSYMSLAELDEGLKCIQNKQCNIIKIFELCENSSLSEIYTGNFDSKLIWCRLNFTEQDVCIARIIPNVYKYIARDKEGGILYLYKDEPIKLSRRWHLEQGRTCAEIFNENFKCISFEDEEAVLIKNII